MWCMMTWCLSILMIYLISLPSVHLCRQQFFEIVKNTLQEHFKLSVDKLLKHLMTSSSMKDDDIRCVEKERVSVLVSRKLSSPFPSPQRSLLWGLHVPWC